MPAYLPELCSLGKQEVAGSTPAKAWESTPSSTAKDFQELGAKE